MDDRSSGNGYSLRLRELVAMKTILRLAGALSMVGVVHLFIVYFDVPKPAAWWVGALIYSGLLAVLLSASPLATKLSVYTMFVVVTWVGSLTVCPCTGAHFLFAPIAGLMSLSIAHAIFDRVLPASVSTQKSE